MPLLYKVILLGALADSPRDPVMSGLMAEVEDRIVSLGFPDSVTEVNCLLSKGQDEETEEK